MTKPKLSKKQMTELLVNAVNEVEADAAAKRLADNPELDMTAEHFASLHKEFVQKAKAMLYPETEIAQAVQPIRNLTRKVAGRVYHCLVLSAEGVEQLKQTYQASHRQATLSYRGHRNNEENSSDDKLPQTIPWLPSRGFWRSNKAYLTLRYRNAESEISTKPQVSLFIDERQIDPVSADLRGKSLHIAFDYSGDINQLGCVLESPEDNADELIVRLYSSELGEILDNENST